MKEKGLVRELEQTVQDGQFIDVRPILRDGKGYMPEFVWFCNKSLKYRGFFGDGEFGEAIGINFAGKLMDYAVSLQNVKAPILIINYLVLHELTHWAQEESEDDETHHKRWLHFLLTILISIEVEKGAVKGVDM